LEKESLATLGSKCRHFEDLQTIVDLVEPLPVCSSQDVFLESRRAFIRLVLSTEQVYTLLDGEGAANRCIEGIPPCRIVLEEFKLVKLSQGAPILARHELIAFLRTPPDVLENIMEPSDRSTTTPDLVTALKITFCRPSIQILVSALLAATEDEGARTEIDDMAETSQAAADTVFY
jgi:hypothetical protein